MAAKKSSKKPVSRKERQGAVMIRALTVQEILDEQIAKKLV